jgi:hypothetical protein
MRVTQQLYDRARTALGAHGFDPDTETRIALFLGGAKCVNATMLAAAEIQPEITVAYPFIHGQYFRELELASLLARVTHWSTNPMVYAEGAMLVAPLWSEWWRIQAPVGQAFDARAAYAALALGHALLARVRLAPAIDGVDEMDPFVVAMRRIEQENGRMIQAQIRLLKDGASPLANVERERMIEAEQVVVDEAFGRFLESIADAQ